MENKTESLMDIRYHGGNESNYSLRGKSVEMRATVTSLNQDGSVKEIQETTTHEISKIRMRVRGARKQTAARSMVPKASITLVKPVEVVAVHVAMRQLTTAAEDSVIAQLAAKVRQLEEMIKALK